MIFMVSTLVVRLLNPSVEAEEEDDDDEEEKDEDEANEDEEEKEKDNKSVNKFFPFICSY